MNAFYFGPSSNYLLGNYHPPLKGNRREGIVLCNPFGQEHLRAHRALRRLAINLANQGYAVLRFDYRGTGDSAGTLAGVTAGDWLEDIGHAVQELMDVAAVPKVSLLGLRLGALLAAQFAVSHKAIARVVCWDPIVSGQAYMDEIAAEIAESPSRSRFIAADGTAYFNGFSLPAVFKNSLAGLDMTQIQGLDRHALALIVSHENPRFSQLQRHLSALPQFHYCLAPAPHDWNYVDHVGGILWPQPIVDAIETYFSSSLS